MPVAGGGGGGRRGRKGPGNKYVVSPEDEEGSDFEVVLLSDWTNESDSDSSDARDEVESATHEARPTPTSSVRRSSKKKINSDPRTSVSPFRGKASSKSRLKPPTPLVAPKVSSFTEEDRPTVKQSEVTASLLLQNSQWLQKSVERDLADLRNSILSSEAKAQQREAALQQYITRLASRSSRCRCAQLIIVVIVIVGSMVALALWQKGLILASLGAS